MLRRAWTGSAEFLKEVRAELEKVSYPSREETTGSTIVVIVFVVIISLFLSVVDASLSNLVRSLF